MGRCCNRSRASSFPLYAMPGLSLALPSPCNHLSLPLPLPLASHLKLFPSKMPSKQEHGYLRASWQRQSLPVIHRLSNCKSANKHAREEEPTELRLPASLTTGRVTGECDDMFTTKHAIGTHLKGIQTRECRSRGSRWLKGELSEFHAFHRKHGKNEDAEVRNVTC